MPVSRPRARPEQYDPWGSSFSRRSRGRRYLLATTTARLAAPIIIGSGHSVTMGGFHGLDPILARQLAWMVEARQVRFVMLGDAQLISRRLGVDEAARPITEWVQKRAARRPDALALERARRPEKRHAALRSEAELAHDPLVLEAHVLVGRKRRVVDRRDRVLRDTRPDAHQRAKIHDRREHHPVDRELLDLVEQRFAPAGVALPRLLLEQVVDVRVAAVGIGPLGEDELCTRLAALPELPTP